MMKTPIYDFAKKYADGKAARFHMPGHKGKGELGCEAYDITEICGADVLGNASGIILESENCATTLFGTAHTFYSTEGSSLSIKAMLATATAGKVPHVLAARNAHKAFIHACALLDLDVSWMLGCSDHICASLITPDDVERALRSADVTPAAVYVTSPDYLGNIADIEGIAEVCKKHGVPLLVDNAHGAYLHFLAPSRHPIALGAAMCCDSAHKTLPVLTGGAYLHVSKDAEASYLSSVRSMMSVFASTSPSYLILESLDLCNRYLSDDYKTKLCDCIAKTDRAKHTLREYGYTVCDTEPLKIVIRARDFGYTGEDVASHLRFFGVEAEFYDDEYLVFMVTPETSDEDFERLTLALRKLDKKTPSAPQPLPHIPSHTQAMSIRKATFAPHETVPPVSAVGRICGTPTVSCPPAVPIAVSGERVTKEMIALFEHYGINEIEVVIE